MEQENMLAPVVALVAWSLVVMAWMVVTRLPAMKRAGIDLSKVVGGRPGALDGIIDDKAQWKAHNYIHLMEQPTLFYAICIVLALTGGGNLFTTVWTAWAYVGLRIVHSLIQATVNVVRYRFLVFALASACLLLLTIQAILIVLI